MHKVNIPAQVRDYVAARGGAPDYAVLDPAATALLVIDMQNYFLADGEMACFASAREIVPNVNRLAGLVRDAGGLVVWIQNAANPQAMQGWDNLEALYTPDKRALRRERLTPGCPAFDLWPELEVDAADARMTKNRYSAFAPGSSDLEQLLQDRGIRNVLVAGTATNVCCESTARDAMMRGFRTTMLSDVTAAANDAEHNAALISFIKYFGDVQSLSTVAQRLQTSRRTT